MFDTSNLTTLSAEALIDAAYDLRDQFFALHDSDDLDDDTLDNMSEIVDALEQLQVEADRRVELTTKRQELSNRVELASAKQLAARAKFLAMIEAKKKGAAPADASKEADKGVDESTETPADKAAEQADAKKKAAKK